MKHTISVLIISILIMVSVIPLTGSTGPKNEKISDEGYILDQMQTENGFYYPVTQNNPAAQGFTPTLTPLAKVRVLIRFQGDISPGPNQDIKLSIRSRLDGEDLTSVQISGSMLSSEESWVNFDFDDITVTVNQTYYMVLSTSISQGEIRWFSMQNMDLDLYESGEAWYLDSEGSVVIWERFPSFTDFCFKTYSYAGKTPDLSCHAVLGWPDRIPGGIVSDDFSIRNIGESHSLLNWEIVSCPEWGNWSFDPPRGFDLEPEDGELVVTVTVEIPDEENTDFTGEIIVGNCENEEDTAVIHVSMSTEKSTTPFWFEIVSCFFQWIVQLIF